MGRPTRSRQTARSAGLSRPPDGIEPPALDRPALFDTGVWTWVRDRRFPELARWFNRQASDGLVLVCDLIRIELTRLAPNERRAREVAASLEAFEAVPMPESLWRRAREIQLELSRGAGHRGIPPADLLIAAAAEEARVPLVHYDRDYERIGTVSGLDQVWLVPDGALRGA